VFGAHGFPAATALPAHGVAGAGHAAAARAGLRRHLAHGHTAAIAGTVATAAVVGAIAVLVMGVPQNSPPGGPAGGSPRAAGRPTATFTPAPRAPKPSRARTSPGPAGPAGSLAQQGVSRPVAPAAARGGAPGASGGGGGAGTAPAPAGAGGGTTSPTAIPTAPVAPAPVANGPVSVSPGSLVLVGLLTGSATGTLTLSAGSTPVTHYTISIPSSLLGYLIVSPASGSIPAHGSRQVTVTLHGLLSLDTTVAVSPGGRTATVVFGLHLGS
jgi:hypothetical protein